MASVTYTLSFDSDLQILTPYPSAPDASWEGGDGDPSAGCIKIPAYFTGPALAGVANNALSWEDLGVPHGATVTGVSADARMKGVGVEGVLPVWTLSASIYDLDNFQDTFPPIAWGLGGISDTEWELLTAGLQDVDPLSSASGTHLLLSIHLQNSGGSPGNAFLLDTFRIIITYDNPVVPALDYEIFPDSLITDVRGGPEYSTTIGTSFQGYEQRNRNWLDAKCSYEVSISELQQSEFQVMDDFYRGRGGEREPFLIKDPFDYSVVGGFIAVGDGESVNYQLVKNYITQDRVEQRAIFRIALGTDHVYLNGNEIDADDYSLNVNTGVITLFYPTTMTITADFEFYVLVRFDGEGLSASRTPGGIGAVSTMQTIGIKEIREYSSTVLGAIPDPDPNAAKFPDLTVQTSGGEDVRVYIKDSAGGFEFRENQWIEGRQKWDLEFQPCSRKTMETVLAHFRSHKGRAYSVRVRDWSDYRLADEPMVALGGNAYQIVKRYGDIIRKIRRPVAGSLLITGNGGVAYTVNWETGVVTFAESIGEDTASASCRFDIGSRFNTDKLQITFEGGPATFGIVVPIIEVLE